MNKQIVDSRIDAKWVVPVKPEGVIFEDYCVIVRNNIITDICSITDANLKYQAQTHYQLDANNPHLLIPGLVNAHTHAAMNLLKGFADDLPLQTWLEKHIWPVESQIVDNEFVYDGTLLACAEMIRGGITCFNEMYFYPLDAAKAATDANLRAMIGLIALEFPTPWANTAEEYIIRGEEVNDELKDYPLIKTAFAPHAPYTVSDKTLTHIATLAEELDLSIHMHIHETQFEVENALKETGQRPIQRLKALDLLSERLIAVHLTQLTEQDIENLSHQKVNAIHCPHANLKLASGFCPVQALLQAEVNLAIGTDGCASNNSLDMIAETKTAALLAKAVANDARALDAQQALYAATFAGAQALGLDHEIGSIEIGKQADLIAIDFGTITSSPVHNPISQLVYASNRDQVSHVWVGGNCLLENKQFTQLDVIQIREKSAHWQQKISRLR